MATASETERRKCQDNLPFKEVSFRPAGLSRSLEFYVGKPLATRVGRGKKESPSHLAKRIRSHQPDLSIDVCNKIASGGYRTLKRVSNTVECIKDNLIFSYPEGARLLFDSPEYKKLIHWAYSLAAHECDEVTKQWKSFSAIVKWAGVQSVTEPPTLPRDFPGYSSSANAKELPPFWGKLLPWLPKVMREGLQTKMDATRLAHLVTSRGFPAGGAKTREDSLRNHQRTLCSSFETVTADRAKLLRLLAFRVGKTVSRTMESSGYKSDGHLSLTSSASFDVSVKDGGRAANIGMRFRKWLNASDEPEVLGTCWFGAPYWTIPGRPRWQTMCRSEIRHGSENVAGESAETFNLDFENFKYQDPIHGLDDATGKQLLQFCLEEGIRSNALSGPVWAKEGSTLGLGSRVPEIRASAVGEPGAKSRVVTVAEDWLTEVLQPWCHHLIGALKTHPSVYTGLTRGWQMFEWVKRLRTVSPPPKSDRYYLSSDLKTATDFCVHEYSQAMLEGFQQGISRGGDPYFSMCTRLLCSSRMYYLDCAAGGDRPLDIIQTLRGVLMGDPGAKVVLTLHNLCAEMEALYRLGNQGLSDSELSAHIAGTQGPPTPSWRCFACSGDDHFGQGPQAYLREITLSHARNGMTVSWPQNFLSSLGGFYCEEMFLTVGLRDDQVWRVETPLYERKYEEQPHIDAMKLRLLSPCAKEHEGKDEPNPAIGKARQIHGMLAWLGGGWEPVVPILSARWERRMEGNLPTSLGHRYLPVRLGGIEAPAYHLAEVEVKTALRSLDRRHLWAIKQVLDGQSTPLLERALSSFATNARARGISSDLIEDQIKETLHLMDLVHGMGDSDLQLAAGIGDSEWRDKRYKDKVHIAKNMGLVDVPTAIQLVERPYLFRDILFPEASLKHGIDPYRTNAYEQKPWIVRERMHLQNISGCISFPQSGIEDSDLEGTIDRIVSWCVENKPLDIPKEVYFLPREVVDHEELATLRVPV